MHLITDETAEDSRAATAMELDPLLDVLAMAETGSDDQFADVLQAAHPVTSSGGLVLAVVTELDEEVARQVASLRQPGGTALAIVLDPVGFGAVVAGPARSSDLSCVPVLRGAGWGVTVVTSDDPLAAVWGVLSGGTRRVGVA